MSTGDFFHTSCQRGAPTRSTVPKDRDRCSSELRVRNLRLIANNLSGSVVNVSISDTKRLFRPSGNWEIQLPEIATII